MVVEAVNSSSSVASRRCSSTSTETRVPGRDFFIAIGVRKTSLAPLANSASISGANASAGMSSMLHSTMRLASAGKRCSVSPSVRRRTFGLAKSLWPMP